MLVKNLARIDGLVYLILYVGFALGFTFKFACGKGLRSSLQVGISLVASLY